MNEKDYFKKVIDENLIQKEMIRTRVLYAVQNNQKKSATNRKRKILVPAFVLAIICAMSITTYATVDNYQYKRAESFLSEIGIEAKSLPRNDAKKVYKDIKSNSFKEEITKELLNEKATQMGIEINPDETKKVYDSIVQKQDLEQSGQETKNPLSAMITLDFDKTSLKAGDVLTVSIGTKNWVDVVNGIVAFNFKLSYDSSIFDYQSVNVTEESKIQVDRDTFNADTTNKDILAILYMDNNFTSPIPKECEMFKVTFKVKSDAVYGNYNFKLYGDKVLVDGQLPTANSITINYPKEVTVSVDGSNNQLSSQNTSTSDNQSKVDEIIKKIDALPETITKNDKETIEKITEELDALPQTDKNKVINKEKLQDATSNIQKIADKDQSNLKIYLLIGGSILFICLIILSLIVYNKKIKKQ